MDETSPVYENFLNQMKRFRRPIRETTRRISASKFLDKPENETIKEIKNLTGEILETLKRQEKVEIETFLDLQRRNEDEKRKNREKEREKRKTIGGVLVKEAQRVAQPLLNFLKALVSFVLTILFGKPLIKLLEFLADEKNKDIVDKIGKFFESKFGVIAGAIAALAAASIGLLGTLGILSTKLLISTITSSIGTLFGTGGIFKKMMGRNVKTRKPFDPVPPPSKKQGSGMVDGLKNFLKQIFKKGLNKGSMRPIPGQGNSDSEPYMLTPGEMVMNPRVVKQFGPEFFASLNKGAGGFLDFYNKGRNVRFPNENTAKLKDLIFDDFSQITRSDKAFKEGAKGLKGARPFKAFSPNMMTTGPTPLIRQSIERPFRTMFGTTVGGFAKRLPIMDLLLDLAFPKPLADGTLENAQRMNIPGTPVIRSNDSTPANVFDTSSVTENISETFSNDTFSSSLPIGDPDVYSVYGIDVDL